MDDKVWMKHVETGEEREVSMGPEVHRLMISGWNQIFPASNAVPAATTSETGA